MAFIMSLILCPQNAPAKAGPSHEAEEEPPQDTKRTDKVWGHLQSEKRYEKTPQFSCCSMAEP